MELHTVVEELPSGAVGEMLPIAVMTVGVGMVPNAAAGAIAVSDIVGANAVAVAVVPGMDAALIEGDGSGGGAGGSGAGTVEPGKSEREDEAGCADSARNGVAAPPVAEVEELTDTADAIGSADIDGVAPVVPAIGDSAVTGTTGVPGVICPVGVAQVTTVPGIVGSEVSGNGANVVSGVPGWAIVENGLGPLSGEDWIVPGVEKRPMAVLPMVETCARQA
jgi:hypothetical protein